MIPPGRDADEAGDALRIRAVHQPPGFRLVEAVVERWRQPHKAVDRETGRTAAVETRT